MNAHTYQHPDGHEVYVCDGHLTVTTADGIVAVTIPIAGAGLVALGEHMIALGKSADNAGDCAEQAGHEIGANLIDAMLAADNQGQRSALIQSAVVSLATLEHHDRAAGGFAVALSCVLEIGLQHLLKGEQ